MAVILLTPQLKLSSILRPLKYKLVLYASNCFSNKNA